MTKTIHARGEVYQGEGWYTFRVWDKTTNDWAIPEMPNAWWVESASDYDDRSYWPVYDKCEHEVIADYYGNDTLPNDPNIRPAGPYLSDPVIRKALHERDFSKDEGDE